MPVYAEALGRLRALGVLYRCFRTRREALEAIASAPHGPREDASRGPLPPEAEAALLAEGKPYAWRLSLAEAGRVLGDLATLTFVEEGAGPEEEQGVIAVRPELAGDVVLARKDLGVSYHLAVTVDDAAQRVSHVIRGCDLFPATHVQRILQALLALPSPVYRHHRLLLRPDGKRFAKRDTAETLADVRARGVTAAALRADLGFA